MKKTLKIIGLVWSCIILLCLFLCLFFNIVYFKTKVSQSSMYPTLNASGSDAHDRIFVNKFEKGAVGDIVVADIYNETNWQVENKATERYVVKRIIAVAGDKIKIEKIDDITYHLIVNDKVVTVKECLGLCLTYLDFQNYVSLNEHDNTRIQDGFILIKENEIFIMGDNWDVSYDCADCGPITKSSLVGRVDIIVPENENLIFGAIKGVFKQIF